jgi:hypothetical protein
VGHVDKGDSYQGDIKEKGCCFTGAQ